MNKKFIVVNVGTKDVILTFFDGINFINFVENKKNSEEWQTMLRWVRNEIVDFAPSFVVIESTGLGFSLIQSLIKSELNTHIICLDHSYLCSVKN